MNVLDYIRALRQRWWVLLLAAVLGALAASFITLRASPVYQSSASILISTPSGSLVDLQAGNQFAQGRAATYAALASTASVLAPALARLGENETVPELADHITAEVQLGTSVIVVTATASEPAVAADRANAVAAALNSEVQSLDVSSTGTGSPVLLQIVQAAAPAPLPVGAGITRNAVLGIIAGLALGVGFVILAATLDSRLRTPRDLASIVGRSPAAIVPRRRSLVGLGAVDARREAFRRLRASLGLTERESHAIAIVPMTREQSISDVVIELGRALAEGGARVVALDADVRPERRARGRSGGSETSTDGLVEVLEGRAKLEHVVRETSVPRLSTIAAGVPSSRYGQMVSRQSMHALVDMLLEEFDIVLVACPPLLARSEGAITASVADTALAVVESGRTTRGDLALGLDLLLGVGVQRPALLLHNVSRLDMTVTGSPAIAARSPEQG